MMERRLAAHATGFTGGVLDPDQPLSCLILQPRFAQSSFWHVAEAIRAVGARANAPPLGLLTVAALLPQHWRFTLVDLNVRDLGPGEWEQADLVCTGGMLPQQPGILEIVARARRDEKFVVVGGPDPTSQPELYRDADARVLGEGEATIPLWLESWRRGQPRGLFVSSERPDVTRSPVPRFDLVNLRHYVEVGIQISRGCPFICEFCDIIELYGRVPRSKTVAQVLAELDRITDLGHRGLVDVTDDNFIGNKAFVKALLPELAAWGRRRGHPFHFRTSATINLADDDELLELMRQADFRHVFVGIETPDPQVLATTQKKVNALRPIAGRVHRIFEHGISVMAGFILGLDDEPPGIADAMLACIEEASIPLAHVSLLAALPGTQLTRRLLREGRLLDAASNRPWTATDHYRLENPRALENTTGGLNFVTSRDRSDVYADLARVVVTAYEPRGFVARLARATRRLQPRPLHVPGWWESRALLGALARVAWQATCDPELRPHYWRESYRALLGGVPRLGYFQWNMALYMHLRAHSRHVQAEMDAQVAALRSSPSEAPGATLEVQQAGI